ncbi:unnamed protein product [Laminaria digitata]
MAVAPGTPIDRVRVKNGYGLCTSALSASVIGHFDASSEQRKATNRAWDDRYHKDATFQMSQLEKNHPVRKILHMQKCYPETVRRLNDTTTTTNKTKNASCALKNQKYAGSAQPRSNSSGAAAERGGVPASASSSDGAQQRRRQRRVTHEYDFCRAKMAYNRTKGREAEVDGILTGRSPVDKNMPLFPSRATHQQLLGLTYRPVNPNHPAPEVPRERKWLGDNVGWEGKLV